MKHCLIVGDSYLTTRHGLHVCPLGPDSFEESLYYPTFTLKKLGFEKEGQVTNMASGGSSMTEIYGRFEKYMHIHNPTHILVGLTNPLRVRHYKHFLTDEEIRKFQEINFEVIMRQNTILPKVMYGMAVDYNIKCYFISNLYTCDYKVRRESPNHSNQIWQDQYEHPYKDDIGIPPDYINGVPQKYQWYGDTPAYFSFCNNGKYTANDTISTNHLSKEGNKICSDILYKKLKELGWDEE